jgi:hypothetical protein
MTDDLVIYRSILKANIAIIKEIKNKLKAAEAEEADKS